MEKLQQKLTELQKKVDQFKYSEAKPSEYWEDVKQLMKINYNIIRIKYHG